MVNNKALDDIAEKITQGLRLLGGVKHEAEQQVRVIVESALENFDVVTNERMEVQEGMLQKTRNQIEALEARIMALEAQIKQQERNSTE